MRLNLINDAEEQRIIDSIGRLSDLAVYVDDTPFQGMVEMRSKARRLYLEHGLDLLVLDYLQLVQGRGRGDNRVQEMSEISRAVKGMARELNVPVLACSQLSRAVEGRSDIQEISPFASFRFGKRFSINPYGLVGLSSSSPDWGMGVQFRVFWDND